MIWPWSADGGFWANNLPSPLTLGLSRPSPLAPRLF
jgi:hypothetical protein